MFYSEITKIIEAGLDRDRDKVRNYALLLAKKLSSDGDEKASKRIENLLLKKNNGTALTDALVAPPVDQESRLGIVDIDYKPVFPDIILADSTLERLHDFENTIRIKDKLDNLGMPFNMSLLLYGPPGCGKTSIANYFANKLDLPLVTARLDTLISSLLGNTAKNLRRIFDFASRQPCVLFLDEFDAIAKARDDQHELGELKRVVNSLLQNMDAYCQGGILVAATNHQELLDDAIWRRFQTIIEVPKPEEQEIEKLLQRINNVMDMKDITAKQRSIIIRQMKGLSYSEIQTLTQNVVKQRIIKNENCASVFDFLCEVAVFKNHANINQQDLIRYLLECGLPQRSIADYFHISQRQVRNCMVPKGDE
ncbi:MAG: ATP-binding protein [Clostridia bacterium]|nr:ATP-binding protein [Clostridia bacterium]